MVDPAAELSGFRHLAYEELASTNHTALELCRAGDPGDVWIRAKVQTAGRGRSGRVWSSPAGNLYVTLLLVDPAPVNAIPQLGIVAGVALARAVSGLPGMPEVRLKWPNDLLAGGAKLAGILAEIATLPDGRRGCAIGFGVNCRSHPDSLAYPATDLRAAGAAEHSPEQVLRHLSREMALVLAQWDRGNDFEQIRDAWLTCALPLGSRLTVRTASQDLRGTFETIDPTGRLMLRTEAGLHTVDAADVFLQQQGEPARLAVR